MATVENPLRKHGCRAMLLGLLFATTSVLASGDLPPEGKARQPEGPAACQEPQSGSPAGSSPASGAASDKPACNASGRAGDSSTDAANSRVSRPGRYGTGYEARQGASGGAGGGRGRGR